jgi:hypothetical protein
MYHTIAIFFDHCCHSLQTFPIPLTQTPKPPNQINHNHYELNWSLVEGQTLEYSQTRNRYGHNGKAMVSGESDGVAMGK